MSEEDVFKCTKCQVSYENKDILVPKMLICGHSLCLGCCEQLKKSQFFIQCQICYKLDTRNLEKIPNNNTAILLLINKIKGIIQHKKHDEDIKNTKSETESNKNQPQEAQKTTKEENKDKVQSTQEINTIKQNQVVSQQQIGQQSINNMNMYDSSLYQSQFFPLGNMYTQSSFPFQEYQSSSQFQTQSTNAHQQHHQSQQQNSSQVSLFVGNLNINTTEKQVKDVFEQFAQIRTIKMLKQDNSAQRKACLITVQQEIAEIAIMKLDGLEINGQKCQVKQFISKHSLNQVRVFVRNLPKLFTEQNLEDLFREIGQITGVKLLKFPDGQSKCMGYITFENPQSVKHACQRFNNYSLNYQNQRYDLQVFDTNDFNQSKQPQSAPDSGQYKTIDYSMENIYPGIKRPPENPLVFESIKVQKTQDPNSFSSIRINFLTETITRQELETVFGIEKGIEHVVFQQGPKGKYAYINYASHEKAANVLKNLNNYILSDGTKLQLRPSYPKNMPSEFNIPEDGETSTLFLKYFPNEFTENDMKILFSQFGAIIDVKISKERHVPMALVKFAQRENAEKAMNAMKGVELKQGLKLFINWKKGKQIQYSDYQLQEAGKTFNMQLPFIAQQYMQTQINQMVGQNSYNPNINMQNQEVQRCNS